MIKNSYICTKYQSNPFSPTSVLMSPIPNIESIVSARRIILCVFVFLVSPLFAKMPPFEFHNVDDGYDHKSSDSLSLNESKVLAPLPNSYDTTAVFSKCWDNVNLFPYSVEQNQGFTDSTIVFFESNDSSWCFPIRNKLNSKFGYRGNHFHKGWDIHLRHGDDVRAAFSGKVRYSKYNSGGYGNLLVIRHFNGTETYYAHLSSRLVSPNQWVEAGQLIGYGGSTGSNSTGPHLHFEIRIEDKAIDPEFVFDLYAQNLIAQELELADIIFSTRGKSSSIRWTSDHDVIHNEASELLEESRPLPASVSTPGVGGPN